MYKPQTNLCFRSVKHCHASAQTVRRFSSCPTNPAANPLIQLQAFSNTRENKWFSKTTGIPHIEFSPQLQLIRSSEGLDKKSKRPQEKLKNAAQDQSKHPSQKVSNSPARSAVSVHTSSATQSAPRPRRRIVPRTSSAVKATRMMGLRLRSDTKVALSIGQVVLARHEKERQGLQRKIARLETRNRNQEKGIKAMEKSMRDLREKHSPIVNGRINHQASNSLRDLIFIVLGVGSVTYICLAWSRYQPLRDGFWSTLASSRWQDKFGTAADVEKIIFNTMPGQPVQTPLIGLADSKNALIAVSGPVVAEEAVNKVVVQVKPVESTSVGNNIRQKNSFWRRLFWSSGDR